MTPKSAFKTYLVLFTLTLGTYWFSFHAPFQLDDYGTVVDNAVIRNIANINFLWQYDPTRFLPHLTFAINYNAHGLDVFGYHIVNFFLHCANGMFVYLLARQILVLTRFTKSNVNSAAFFIAVLFLLHPLQTSTVTYIVQRSTLMAALCYLAGIYFYMQYRLTSGRLVWALLPMIMGMFCKPNFITLPFALGLIDFIFLRPAKITRSFSWRVWSVFLLPVIIIPVLLGLWQARAQGLDHISFLTRETDALSRQEYFLTQMHVIVDYIRLTVFPLGQNLDYDYRIIQTLFSPETMLKAGMLLGLFISAAVLVRRKPLYAFGVLFAFLTLSVESSVFPISDVIFEHRMYLPLFGVLLAIIPFMFELIKQHRDKILWVLVIIMMLLAGYRNYLWSDQILFLEDNYRKSPNKARVINRLGYAYFQEKKAQKAYEKFTEAIAADPGYPEAYLNRGLLMYEFNNLEAALQDFGEAIKIRSHFYQAYNNRGIALSRLGEDEWAMADYNKAIALNRYFAEAYINRAQLFIKHAEWQKALRDLDHAYKIDPYNTHVFNNRGIVYINQNSPQKAVNAFRKAVQIDPSNISAVENYNNVLKLHNKQP